LFSGVCFFCNPAKKPIWSKFGPVAKKIGSFVFSKTQTRSRTTSDNSNPVPKFRDDYPLTTPRQEFAADPRSNPGGFNCGGGTFYLKIMDVSGKYLAHRTIQVGIPVRRP